MTEADMVEVLSALRAGLGSTPATGDLVLPNEIVALHSEGSIEDGSGTLRLFDLVGGRTGAQVLVPGRSPGPIRYAD